jgi:Domain of unknown function (DUF4190)
MADPDRNPPEPPASNDPDDVTQQVPTQQPPPYQQQPYQQPPYQPPQYETPQYETPQYQAPQYDTPTYGTPTYGTPSYEQPYGAAAYSGGYPTQPGYGYTAAQTEPLAVWGLVVAILGWVACPIPFVPAIVALVLAGNAQRNIDASGGAKEGRGINTATKILSWINIGLWALISIFVVVAIVASAAASV